MPPDLVLLVYLLPKQTLTKRYWFECGHPSEVFITCHVTSRIAGFPTVVSVEVVTLNNTGDGINFDTARSVFHSNVVSEYLDGTGIKEGLSSLHSMSHLEVIFASTKAIIMLRCLSSGSRDSGSSIPAKPFFSACLRTVPRGVVLPDVVKPQSVKPINATLDFDAAGNVVFSGYIRVRFLAISS